MSETRPIQPYTNHDPASSVLRVAPYDPRAPHVATLISGLIVEQLGTVTVEHIGSTAVPGCDGKGIVDLMIVIEPNERTQVVDHLLSLGFQSQSGGFRHPAERPMLEGAIQFDGEGFRIHLHIVPSDSEEPGVVRRFRDRLRAD